MALLARLSQPRDPSGPAAGIRSDRNTIFGHRSASKSRRAGLSCGEILHVRTAG